MGVVIDPVMCEEVMVTVIATGFDDEGIRERVKRPANLKDFMKVVDKPNHKRKQESFAFKNEALGLDDEAPGQAHLPAAAGGLSRGGENEKATGVLHPVARVLTSQVFPKTGRSPL